MALREIPLDQITEAHLVQLIDAQVSESLHIEYKRQSYGQRDEDRREFLADVSSFANTAGGDLVIGVDEKDGRPTVIVPVGGVSAAAAMVDRLDKMAHTGLEPSIAGLRMRAVAVTGGAVIVIRIPRSFLAPHRVSFGNSGRFWARSTASPRKYEPSVAELRRLFVALPELSERIQRRRIDRAAKIAVGEAGVAMSGGAPLLVVHVAPLVSFDSGQQLSMFDTEAKRHYFAPPFRKGIAITDYFASPDGFVTVTKKEGRHVPQVAYGLAFRSGLVEGVSTFESEVKLAKIDAGIVDAVFRYAMGLAACGLNAPFVAMASILAAKDAMFEPYDTMMFADPVRSPRGEVHFVETVLETLPATAKECGSALAPLLDHVASLVGSSRSGAFDQSGQFLLNI